MKKIVILTLMSFCMSMLLPAQNVKEVKEKLRYCESTYPYDGGILIANFGTDELNPLNSEGKGYIVFYKDGKSEIIVPADGNLSGPKGMFERNGYLYVCDVNKIVVYNLADKAKLTDIIDMPEGDMFVNDLAAYGNTLYVTVTNTDKIYSIDISDPARPGQPVEWLEISGPNGILVGDDVMYVATYATDGAPKAENVIYRIDNLRQPKAIMLNDVPGQYDGIAFSSDDKSLIVSTWEPAQLSRVNLSDGTMKPIDIKVKQSLTGPADITVKDGFIYIPDLPNSRMIIVKE